MRARDATVLALLPEAPPRVRLAEVSSAKRYEFSSFAKCVTLGVTAKRVQTLTEPAPLRESLLKGYKPDLTWHVSGVRMVNQ